MIFWKLTSRNKGANLKIKQALRVWICPFRKDRALRIRLLDVHSFFDFMDNARTRFTLASFDVDRIAHVQKSAHYRHVAHISLCDWTWKNSSDHSVVWKKQSVDKGTVWHKHEHGRFIPRRRRSRVTDWNAENEDLEFREREKQFYEKELVPFCVNLRSSCAFFSGSFDDIGDKKRNRKSCNEADYSQWCQSKASDRKLELSLKTLKEINDTCIFLYQGHRILCPYGYGTFSQSSLIPLFSGSIFMFLFATLFSLIFSFLSSLSFKKRIKSRVSPTVINATGSIS